jgi:hypothetical protein
MSRKFIFGGSFGSAVPLLLDLYPATAAYSVRKLRTAYTGACMRVRRSSDNAEQDIGFVGNDLDTAALLSFVGAVNGFVTTWYDQQGSNNASQSVLSNQARIVASGVLYIKGIYASLNFISSDSLLATNIFETTYPYNLSLISVSHNNNSASVGTIISGHTFSSSVQHLCDRRTQKRNTILYQASGTNTFDLPSQDNTNNSRLLSIFTAATGNAESYYNGLLGTSGTVIGGTTTITANMNIGIGGLGSLVGGVQEIIIYKSNQLANRTAIETNINAYYGIYP